MSERIFVCVLHHGTQGAYMEFRADPEDIGELAQAVADGATIVLEFNGSVRVLPAHSVHYIWAGYNYGSLDNEKYQSAAITYYRKAK
jgi:hypothetical protein